MKKVLSLLAIAMASISLAKAEVVDSLVIVDDGISQKWEVKAMVGGMFTNHEPVEGAGHTRWGESLQFELGAGYNLNEHLYLGVSSGYFHKYGFTAKVHQNNQLIPLLGDIVYRWNKWEKWSLFAEARAGYLFNLQDTKRLPDGTEYEPAGYSLFEIMPGAYYRIRKNIDLRFSIGFTYGVTAESGDLRLTNNEPGVVAQIGLNFRKAPKSEVRIVMEEPIVDPVVTEPIVIPEPEPVRIVETTTPEQKQLGEREVVIFYTIRKHNILPDKDALLQEMADFVKTHKTSHIVLKSYADKGTGNYQLNQMYSRNRMEEVRKHLIEMYGIPADQIDASYYGDTVQPFEENDKNRCSIITVREIE